MTGHVAQLCFITTCRGRLEHLKQSLPTFVNQPGTSCVVVDYDCPQDTAGWVAANHPQVYVVRETNRPNFEMGRSRNLGAGATRAQWLCFVDADTLLEPGFAAAVLPLLERGHYLRPFPRETEATGFCICHRDDFVRIEGYDSALQNYGMDDMDFYHRLGEEGVKSSSFPGELIRMIAHDHETRMANFTLKDRRLSIAINQTYCAAKWDLMRMRRANMPLAARLDLYRAISGSVVEAHRLRKPVDFNIPIGRRPAYYLGELGISLAYRTDGDPAVMPRIEPAP
ncbi:MAG: glycosyltransferase family A protein [Pseudomonadota bacterium]